MTEQYIEDLIRKYAQGTATKHEMEQLMNWYRSSAIGDVKWPSSTAGEKQELSERILGRLLKEAKPRSAVRSMRWLKVAAVLIPVIGVAIFYLLLRPPAEKFIAVTNPSRQIQLVHLPDGSKVWLNASTKFQYSKSFKNNREVILDGEAFFEVQRDPDHPFTINAGDLETTVLGTSFNVRAYEVDSISLVTVVKGTVSVRNNSIQSATLAPSSQLRFNRVSRRATTAMIDTTEALAWRNGKLVFEGKSLGEISETIEKWYGIRIVFKNRAMIGCRYYMSFDNIMSLDTLLSNMSQITGMTYVIEPTTKVVELSGGGCNN